MTRTTHRAALADRDRWRREIDARNRNGANGTAQMGRMRPFLTTNGFFAPNPPQRMP